MSFFDSCFLSAISLAEIVFFFSVFLIFSLPPSTSMKICRVNSCGIQPIRFPFRLNNQPSHCGYPRFNLSCENEARATLALPLSGDFTVVNIDYIYQYIWINDPDHCTAKRLLEGLDLSGTPFGLLHPRSYTFFNCSSASETKLKLPESRFISCLSGSDFSVVAIPTKRLDLSRSLSSLCSEMATVLVPLSWTGWSDTGDSIMLTWHEPNCMSCESRAGTCMFKSDVGMDIGCSGGFSNGLTTRAKLGITFGVAIALLLFTGLIIYLSGNVDNHQSPNTEESSAEPRSDGTVVKGLDGKFIESYPITLLGESRRLARPNDNTCSICLGEYQAKETLRTIPSCNHYFHAICIDEWLQLNIACPLCRGSPKKPAPSIVTLSS